MRLAIIAIVATLFLLVYGFVETTESLRFRAPRAITYEQFVKEMPQEGWFHITGSRLDVIGSAIEESEKTHTIEKAFVPVSPANDLSLGEAKDEKTYLLMETKDEGIMETVRSLKGMTGDQAMLTFVKANPQKAFPMRDVEGMIKAGLSADSDTRTKMMKLDNTLAPNWVILQEGKHPSLLLGIGMFLGGILLAVGQVLYYARRRMSRA